MWILENWYFVAVVAVLLTMGKLAVTWAIFQTLGHTARVAAATGLCLAQIGEFAFVLGSIDDADWALSENFMDTLTPVRYQPASSIVRGNKMLFSKWMCWCKSASMRCSSSYIAVKVGHASAGSA